MCIWSAFVGKKAAAPEVWKTGTAVEGFWSGFYTGIATVDENGIHGEKCCGHSKYWQEKFDQKTLPGRTGFFHSRTQSCGGDAWAHPFIGSNKKVAVISQGHDGVYPDMAPWSELGSELERKGKTFIARDIDIPVRRYPALADGAKVHTAEIIAQSVEYFYEQSGDAIFAIRQMWDKVREEAITLFLFHDQIDRIYFINLNQSGVIRFTPDGAYAASNRMSFGLPLAKCTELPLNSVGYFTADGLCFESLPDPGFPIYDTIPEEVLTAALAYLRENPDSSMGAMLDKGCGHLFPADGITVRAYTAHRLIETFFAEGWIRGKDHEIEYLDGTCGLSTRFSLTEKFFKQFR